MPETSRSAQPENGVGRRITVVTIPELRQRMVDKYPDGPPPMFNETGGENYPDWHEWSGDLSALQTAEKGEARKAREGRSLCREPQCVRKVGHPGFHQAKNNHRWGYDR